MNRRESIIAGLAGITAVAAFTPKTEAAQKGENPELDKIRALLRSHDDAMTNHDMNGVLATMTEKTTIMGTGPGEVWAGPTEIKEAYTHFFEDFDKGQQKFSYKFRVGGLGADMGWLLASGNISGKKAGKSFAFPLNLSLTVSKAGGQWKIAAMHFSTLTGPESAKK